MTGWSALAQTDDAVTAPATPADAAAGDAGDTAPEETTVAPETQESTTPPTEEPVATVAPTEQPATEQSLATEPATLPATIAPTLVPQTQPALTYTAASQPVCQTNEGEPAVIAFNGILNYACTTTVELTGEQIAPDAVALHWSVSASVDDGWGVQLRSPATGGGWTAAGAHRAVLSVSADMPAGSTAATSDGFASTVTFSFDLRIRRSACDAVARQVAVQATGVAALPGVDAAITQTGEAASPLAMIPTLASIPEPTLAFPAPLDFGTVPVTAAGPETPATTADLVVDVQGLSASCGTWRLSLRASSPDAGEGVLSASALTIVAVNGQPLATGPCALADGCLVEAMQAGPGADDTSRSTVTVRLRLPDGSPPGSLDATITGRLEPAE